jgi:hypothetical protein
MRKQTPGKIK